MRLAAALALGLLLTATTFAGDPPGESARPEVLEVFDVRDLVDGEPSLEALLGSVRRAAGEGLGSLASQPTGIVIVRATPAAIARVKEALASLRRAASTVLTVDVRFLTVGPEHLLEEIGVLEARSPVLLDEAERAALLAEVERSEECEALSSPRLTVREGEKAKIMIGRQISYIRDFEIERTEDGGSIANPVLGVLTDGLTLDLVAKSGMDAGTIDLDLELKLAEVAEPLPTRRVAVGGERRVPTVIQVPESTELRIVRSLTVADGGSALFSIGPLPFAKGPGARLLVVVRATRTVLEDD